MTGSARTKEVKGTVVALVNLFPYYVQLSFAFVEVVLLLVGLIKISLTFLLL